MTLALDDPALGAWTHTLRFDDVLGMLLLAREGQRIDAWRADVTASSRYGNTDQRGEQLRIAQAILRPQDRSIPADGFLEEVRSAPRLLALNLIYGRYLAAHPLARALAQRWHEAHTTTFSAGDLDRLLADLAPGIAASTRKRSRSAAISEFVRAGVLDGTARDGLRRVGASVHPTAFARLLLDDLHGRGEAFDSWIVRQSTPAVIFAMDEARAQACLDAAIRDGHFRRSYYDGTPRIVLP